MAQDVLDTDTQDQPKRAWLGGLSWPVLLVLAWILYELTAQPAIGVAALCLKFGWDDFRTAFWLRWMDANRPRGRACFWLYLASGLWTSAIAGTVMTYGFLLVAGPQPQAVPGGGPSPHLIGAMLTALVGFGLCTLATGISLGVSLWYGIRLWLDPGVHHARRNHVWPPPDTPRGRHNRVGWLVVTALVLTGIPALVLVLFAFALHFGAAGAGGRPAAPPFLALVLGMACVVGLPLFILAVREFLNRRVIAAAPSQCWGTEEYDVPFTWLRAPESEE
jgi:hypothetical protein